MRIVVIIPCRDRAATLSRCLNSIALAATSAVDNCGLPVEIRTLIVNDRSADGLVLALAQDFPWVDVVDVDGSGPGAARNTGFKHADADLYLLTDSDCVVADDWFLSAMRWYRDRQTPMAQGVPWLYQRTQNLRLGDCEENLYRHMFSRYVQGGRTSMIDPRCMMLAREYFDRFPRDVFATWITDASFEDRAVIGGLIENGLRVEWYPDARVFHEDPPDEGYVWRQKYRHGAGRVYSWSDPPEFDFLLSRYFLKPIAAGNDPAYVVPAHIAFLLGYRDAYLRKKPHDAHWWIHFFTVLTATVNDAPLWLQQVEPVVSDPESAEQSLTPGTIRPGIQMVVSGCEASIVDSPMAPLSASQDSRVKIAGIGTIIADHVFVADGDAKYRYHGSRGGGTVWNILAHLSRAGYDVAAYGVRADDGPGTEATGELEFLGVDTSKLIKVADGKSLVFTQWLNGDIRHGTAIPQANFSLTCPVCERTPASDRAPEFRAEHFKSDGAHGRVSLTCTDRLTSATVAAARRARAMGSLTALDLGGVSGLSRKNRGELIDWAGEFDVAAIPAAVAAWLLDSGVASDFASRLMSKRTAALAITNGREGFELFLRVEDGTVISCKCSAPDTEAVVDATGAGDAFASTLIGEILLRAVIGDDDIFRLHFRPNDLIAMAPALTAAPVPLLYGIGARALFPEYPNHTAWGTRLTGMRGLLLDDLRRRYAGARPCYFCARD